MITLIVGQNAIGKSVYLKDRAKAASLNDDIIFNMVDSSYLDNISYNTERIEHLKDILQTEDITENDDILVIKTDEVKLNTEFIKLLTLICKNCKKMYLDEPEYCLTYHQIGFLVWFLSRVEVTFDEIVIVTHSEVLLGLESKEVKTVDWNEETHRFELVELKEKEYVTID